MQPVVSFAKPFSGESPEAACKFWKRGQAMDPSVAAEIKKIYEFLDATIAAQKKQVLELDGARGAHRHLLEHLLAKLPQSEVGGVIEDLVAAGDLAASEMGELWLTGYRKEMDNIYEEMRAHRT